MKQVLLKDEIPFDAELQSSYPLWLRPTIEETQTKQKFLVWPKIDLEGKTRRFVVKIKIKDHFNPQEPIVTFPKDLIPKLKTKKMIELKV